MFEKLIPIANAQFAEKVKSTAAAGGSAAVGGGEAGIQQLIGFVINNVGNWIAGGIIIIISWVIAKMIAGGLKREIIKKKGEDVQESVLILVERMTTIVILTIGITVAAAINGLNFTAVIGALSLGIGFALKDIIGNFISGIIMLSQDRVKIGDLIKIGETVGTIVSIDTRATVLQAIDGTEVVIPNQSMLNETLVSYTTNPFRRIELIVGVDYGTDLPMVTSLIKGILEKDKDIVPKPESLVLVEEFGDSAINIKVLFWIESSNNWMKVRSNLANRIKKTFNELKINIPFPIRTLKLDKDDRSFLKTMDSMKKSIVPERKVMPSHEEVKAAVSGTEDVAYIPEEIFEEKKSRATGVISSVAATTSQPTPTTTTPQKTTAPAQSTTSVPNAASAPQVAPMPTAMHAAAPDEPTESTTPPTEEPALEKPFTPEAPQKPTEPTPPPTHL